MLRFQVHLVIRRPPREVLCLLTRLEDILKFVPQVVSAKRTSPGPVPVGTMFVQRGSLFGRPPRRHRPLPRTSLRLGLATAARDQFRTRPSTHSMRFLNERI
jgi:hypothetical protein